MSISKDHLKKILDLNTEYLKASPDRRKEIEKEMIATVPPQLINKDHPTDAKIEQFHNEIKEEVLKLYDVVSQHDYNAYVNKLADVHGMIRARAEELGVRLENTNIEALKQLLDTKFKK